MVEIFASVCVHPCSLWIVLRVSFSFCSRFVLFIGKDCSCSECSFFLLFRRAFSVCKKGITCVCPLLSRGKVFNIHCKSLKRVQARRNSSLRCFRFQLFLLKHVHPRTSITMFSICDNVHSLLSVLCSVCSVRRCPVLNYSPLYVFTILNRSHLIIFTPDRCFHGTRYQKYI